MFANKSDEIVAQPFIAERLLADAARAAHGGRKRMASLIDLFLPDNLRLSDYHRVTLRRFLSRLVAAIESDLRQKLISGHSIRFSAELVAALGSNRISIAMPALERVRALHDVDLVALLLARVEEARIETRLRSHAARGKEVAVLIESLLADSDPAISTAAMALLIAESRRTYIFDDALLARTDLPAELQYRLTWWVAAALRDYMTRHHKADPVQTDTALLDVATISLAGYDEGETLESTAMQLARLLGARGWIDDSSLAAACTEGHLGLFVAMLAVRAGLDFDAARALAIPPHGERLIVLLRALDVARSKTATILLAIGVDDSRIDEHMAMFDYLDHVQAQEAIRPWQVDSGYRSAIAALAAGMAERGDGWA